MNQCHQTWDTAFREDDKPWVVKDPKGAVVLMLLRRLNYNALALFSLHLAALGGAEGHAMEEAVT
jgi:hypothetical protein